MPLKASAVTSGAVSVLITSTPIVSANVSRSELTIVNDHATQIVYLQLTSGATPNTAPAAVANQGIRLNAAGGSWTTNAYKGAVAGISVGGTSVVTVVEV